MTSQTVRMFQALKRAGGRCTDAPIVRDSLSNKVQVAVFRLPDGVTMSDILSDLACRGIDAVIWPHARDPQSVVVPVK